MITKNRFKAAVSRMFLFFAGVAVTCVTTLVVADLYKKPALTVVSAAEAQNVSPKLGAVEIAVHIVRHEFCEGDTDRNLWRMEWRPETDLIVSLGKETVDRLPHKDGMVNIPVFHPLQKRSSPIGRLGENIYLVEVPIPADVEPGEWNYTSRTRYKCPILPNAWLGSLLYTVTEFRSPDVKILIPAARTP